MLSGLCPAGWYGATADGSAVRIRLASGERSLREEDRAVVLDDRYEGAREAFWQTIELKLRQFYHFVPKGSNPPLTGMFIEELVRGFIREWISPCQLLHGTLWPHNFNPQLEAPTPKQIDGIVFDPRKGPSIIREGGFLVVAPQFCCGLIEIKASESDLRGFQDRLKGHHAQYFIRGGWHQLLQAVIGVVIHDPEPERHSRPDWLSPKESLHEVGRGGHCPIYILFKKNPDDSFEPFRPAIDALIDAIFSQAWSFDPRLDQFIREVHSGLLMSKR
jgi:hypothetical protein